MSSPFFSIITPTYNRAHLLPIAIKSVLSQSFTDWEHIIIDDGSTDNTQEVVAAFSENRIKYFYQKNSERSAARNNGIAQAKGQFCCFIDSDDYYSETFLETIFDFIKNKNFEKAFYYSGSYVDDGVEKRKGAIYINTKVHPAEWAWHTLIQNCGVCASKDFFNDQHFPEQFNVWEDMHLWTRLLILHPFYQIENYLATVNQHEDRSINNMFENINIGHIDKYAEAVNHWYKNYFEIIKPVFTMEMKRDFLHHKYWIFAEIAAQKGMTGKALQLMKRTLINYPAFIFNPKFIKVFLIMIKNNFTK